MIKGKLEHIKNSENTICIFGITWQGILLAYYLDREDIVFADNNIEMQGKTIYKDYLCINPKDLDTNCLVVISVLREENIRAITHQLNDLGIYNITGLDMAELDNYKYNMDAKTLIEYLWLCKMHKEIDLDNPKTLNEKLQWIKLNDKRKEYVLYADKYRVRDYIKDKFGEEYLIPLLHHTDRCEDIRIENMPDEHFAIKTNCWSGDVKIIRDKNKVNYFEIREEYNKIFNSDFAKVCGEWWYSEIKPEIVVEKLLEMEDGKLPNDYKLHFIGGKLEFVYCAIDREGENYRKIYSPQWEPLPFAWNGTATPMEEQKKDIPRPKFYDQMVSMGAEVAKDLPYVRVDFYETENQLYFGEITISHGGGFDYFIPSEYDLIYGEKLSLMQYFDIN